jgi:hypothetical protein
VGHDQIPISRTVICDGQTNWTADYLGSDKMFQKSNLFDRMGAIAGFSACAVLTTMLVSGPTLRPVEPAVEQAAIVQVAKYRPGAGQPDVQDRVARNDAMTSMPIDPATVARCPRCR